MPSEDELQKKHLFVLVHGLWGNHSHMDSIRDSLEMRLKNNPEVVIFKPKNSGYFRTLHGIRVVSYNVLEELCAFVSEYGPDKFNKISFVGYSMGGLVSRFIIGKIVTERKKLFQNMQFTLFITFATPHLGVNLYFGKELRKESWLRQAVMKVLTGLGTTILGRSGTEIFIRGGRNKIMVDLAQGEYLYGLSKFEHRVCFANVKNDRTVAFYTSLITNFDPFIETENKMEYHFNHDLPINVEDYPVMPRILNLDKLDPAMKRIQKSNYTNTITVTLMRIMIISILLPITITINVFSTCYSYIASHRLHNSLVKNGSKESSENELGSDAVSLVRDVIGDLLNNEGSIEEIGSSNDGSLSPNDEFNRPTLTSREDKWNLFIQEYSTESNHSKFSELPFDPDREFIYQNLTKLNWIRIPVYIRALNAHDGIVARKGLENATPYGVANVKFASELINYLIN